MTLKKSTERHKISGLAKLIETQPTMSYICIFVLVFVSYLFASLHFNGPAYLSDEVGYLTKAATISGSNIDAASSWHGGYSILISPAFFIFNDPTLEWVGVIVINSLMWALSGVLLFYILRQTYNGTKLIYLSAATVAALVYPSWISMSGYAFSTSGFVFILMLTLASLMKSNLTDKSFLGLFAFFGGLLYWVHPIGIVFIPIMIGYFVVKGIIDKKFLTALGLILITLTTVAVYQYILKPFFTQAMMPVAGLTTANDHYGGTLTAILTTYVKEPSFWIEIPVLLMGLTSYLIIATYGIALYALDDILHAIFVGRKKNKKYIQRLVNDKRFLLTSIIILALIGTIAIETLTSSGARALRADHWIYGRYTEMFMLPLIALGILAKWKWRTAITGAIFVVLSGIVLSVYTNGDNTTFTDINLVNLQAFWPLVFIKDANYIGWFLIGAIGVLFSGLIAHFKKKWLLALALPLVIMTFQIQVTWHKNILDNFSKTSGLHSFVYAHYSPDTCIGVMNKGKDSQERLSLSSFYLHEYTIEKISPMGWLRSCEGPYLTFDLEAFKDIRKQVRVIGREVVSGLYLVERSSETYAEYSSWTTSDFYINIQNEDCVIRGCFVWDAGKPGIIHTKVGRLMDHELRTTSTPGFLLFGPYAPLKKGDYSLLVDAKYKKSGDGGEYMTINISSNKGQHKIFSTEVRDPRGEGRYDFSIDDDVLDLEIQFLVDSYADLDIRSYTVTTR